MCTCEPSSSELLTTELVWIIPLGQETASGHNQDSDTVERVLLTEIHTPREERNSWSLGGFLARNPLVSVAPRSQGGEEALSRLFQARKMLGVDAMKLGQRLMTPCGHWFIMTVPRLLCHPLPEILANGLMSRKGS
jgi:hypothetical protein